VVKCSRKFVCIYTVETARRMPENVKKEILCFVIETRLTENPLTCNTDPYINVTEFLLKIDMYI
jgi:hypothetical protein